MREALESELELVSTSLAFDIKIRVYTFSADHVMKLSVVRPAELLIPAIGTLTKTTKLTDKFLVTPGDTNTAAQNDFAVQVAMSDRLALSVGYGIRYNSNPPLGAKTTDQLTTINIVYDIKETTASTK